LDAAMQRINILLAAGKASAAVPWTTALSGPEDR